MSGINNIKRKRKKEKTELLWAFLFAAAVVFMSSVAKEIPRQDLLFTHASQPVLVAFLQTFTLLLHFLSCLLADSYRDRCSPGRDNGHAAKIAK